MYNPLPNSLTIKNSKLHGLGLFAIENIKKDTELGISHFYCEETIQRTPLGGFYNHSENPNLILVEEKTTIIVEKTFIAKKKIKKGDELTMNYKEFAGDRKFLF